MWRGAEVRECVEKERERERENERENKKKERMSEQSYLCKKTKLD